MDESEWLTCTELESMLEFLRGKVSERKLRLFAVACCRRIWPRLWDGSRQAVEVAERYADGLASPEELMAAADEGRNVSTRIARQVSLGANFSAAHAATGSCAPAQLENGFFWGAAFVAREAADAATDAQAPRIGPGLGDAAERTAQAAILRDLCGPLPFRPVSLEPAWQAWNHGTIPAIARHIYEDRAFHDLPILADALEDAGCADAAILDHCRQPGEHVRVCWVVDLMLGKA